MSEVPLYLISRLQSDKEEGCEERPHRQSPTLHPHPCTLHPAPHIQRPTPYALRPQPYTLHPTLYALHPTPYTRGETSSTVARGRRAEGGGAGLRVRMKHPDSVQLLNHLVSGSIVIEQEEILWFGRNYYGS